MAHKFVLLMPHKYGYPFKERPVGRLILGNVGFHRELAQEGYYTCGGGYWDIDDEKKTITLDDYSSDFGEAQFADRDWEYIECDSDFEGYTVTYQYPKYCLRGSEHEGELVDVTPMLKFCL